MSNRLSLEFHKVTPRSTGEFYNEIVLFDDYDRKTYYMNQDESPTEPGEFLLDLFKKIKSGEMDDDDMIDHHIQNSNGIDIEDDWIEWDDPRFEKALKFWTEN